MANDDDGVIDLIKGHACYAACDEAKCSTVGVHSFSLISKQPFTAPPLLPLLCAVATESIFNYRKLETHLNATVCGSLYSEIIPLAREVGMAL